MISLTAGPEYSCVQTDLAIGVDAQKVRESRINISATNTRIESHERFREAWGKALFAAIAEASTDNWDQYDARPVNHHAVILSFMFLEQLSPGIPLPEFAVDPDGDMALDWSPDANR